MMAKSPVESDCNLPHLNDGGSWIPDQIALLVNMRNSGKSFAQIATHMRGRDEDACRAAWDVLTAWQNSSDRLPICFLRGQTDDL